MKSLENVKKMPLQCVVINWDRTLVSSTAMIHQAYLKTMKLLQINPEWSPEDTVRQNGRPPVEIFNDAGIWGSKAIGSVAKDFFYKNLEDIRQNNPELLYLKDGAIELLEWFFYHHEDPIIIICGNKTQSILEQEVHNLVDCGLVDKIIGSNFDSQDNKPNPKFFERIIAGITIENPAEEVLYIGDNPQIDPSFASAYGASSILIADTSSADAASLTELLEKLDV